MHAFPDFSRRRGLQGLAALAAGGLVPGLQAQTARWPDKPLRVVVPFPPGGLTDAYARLFADHFTQTLGQPSMVDNRPGGGAIIGISQVAKAPADGYTLLVSTSGTVWQNRVLYSKLPYNLDTDLTPIALFPSGPLAVAVAPEGQGGPSGFSLANLVIEDMSAVGAGDVFRKLGRFGVVAVSNRIFIREICHRARRIPQLEPFGVDGGRRGHRPRIRDPYRAHAIRAVLPGRSGRRLVHVIVRALDGWRDVGQRGGYTGEPWHWPRKPVSRAIGSRADIPA